MTESHIIPVGNTREKLIDKVQDWKYSEKAGIEEYTGHLDNGNVVLISGRKKYNNEAYLTLSHKGRLIDSYESNKDGEEISKIFQQLQKLHYDIGVAKIQEIAEAK